MNAVRNIVGSPVFGSITFTHAHEKHTLINLPFHTTTVGQLKTLIKERIQVSEDRQRLLCGGCKTIFEISYSATQRR
jgi:hypothetical protein